jgi:uncharacterized protein
MEMWMQTVSAFGVGALVGLTGIGGGALMTPLLVLVFGFAPATAVGTDLLFASVTKSAGVFVHGRRGTVEWRIAAWLAAGSLPSAALTWWAISRWATSPRQFDRLIVPALAVALTLTGIVLLLKEPIQRFAGRRAKAAGSTRMPAPVTVAVGAVVGVLVTLTSIGAGALVAAALLFVYPRLPAVKVAGTDLAHAVPLAAVAGVGHWQLGTVDFSLLGSLLLGSLPGIYLGSHLGGTVPEGVLRSVLASLLLLVGANLAFR